MKMTYELAHTIHAEEIRVYDFINDEYLISYNGNDAGSRWALGNDWLNHDIARIDTAVEGYGDEEKNVLRIFIFC